jgi:tetratricopeptide repeat protein 8
MSGASDVRSALQSGRRTGTARPMTNLGREVRLGTASLQASGNLVDSSRINVKKYAGRTGIAMAITDYLIYVEHNTRKALEMCAEATKAHDFKDWWWKARLGKCYFKLGLFREAERQFRSSIKAQPTINTYLELCNVYMRMDLPNTALDLLTEASEKFTAEPRILLGIGRLYDMLHNSSAAIGFYKKVLSLEASNVESIACLGAHFFYSDQPEVSIRYYRRLLQMGVNNTELWNNLGLCCFYASQYDMALNCFERALSMASDDNMADVWYNIGHVGVALGDLGLAYQAFKVAVSVDPTHGEALNNIAVLEMRRQKVDVARSCLSTSSSVNTYLFEPLYNNALLLYRLGDFQEAYSNVCKALEIYPNHDDSKELKDTLQKLFASS